MPLPIAHALMGASVVAALHPRIVTSKAMALGAVLAILPDLDLLLVWGFDMRGGHRTWSHSAFFAFAVGVFIWRLLGLSKWRESLAYGCAFLSHSSLDFLAAKAGAGVTIFWPFSYERFKLNLWGFSELSKGLPISELVYYSIVEMVLFGAIFLIVLLLRRPRHGLR